MSYGIHIRPSPTAATLGAALCHRAGLDPIDASKPEHIQRTQENAAETGWRLRELTLPEICQETLRLEDIREPRCMVDTIRAAVSTGSMTNIFTTAVNARIVQSFSEATDSTQGWVRETNVKDFKTNERISLGKTATLTPHARGGTAESATRSDSVESYKVKRYSAKFDIDEQDIIDDSMSALLDLPRQFGSAARRVRPDLVYSILLANAALGADSVALFHADHGSNTSTAALAATGLETAIATMGKQTQDGVNINVQAQFLIVPIDLRYTAMTLLESATRIVSSASGGTLNPLLDEMIGIRSDNRIGAAGVTDPSTGTAYPGSATNWFLAASPNEVPTIEVGYVGGNKTPTVNGYALTNGQFGLGWAVKFDVGAKALDYRGLYYSDGTV